MDQRGHRLTENVLRYPLLKRDIMRRALFTTTLGIAALVVGATALPSIAEDPSRTTLVQMIPALSKQQTKGDLPTEAVDLSIHGVDEESIRYLGADDVAKYWVAQSVSAEVCLVMHIPGIEVSASSCAPITDFYRSGIGLKAGQSVDDPANSAEAYLLPSGISVSSILAEWDSTDLILLGENLVTVTSGTSLQPVTVARNHGSDFYFSPLSTNGR